MKKKEKFLDKIVKKDYNMELEKILEEKNFNENVKSMLLSIFYKVEVAYPDVMLVKQNVVSKEKYYENLITIVQNKCDEIELVKMNSQESKVLGSKNFLIEEKEKKIICYPIERKFLYALSKIGKQKEIIKNSYCLLSMTISDLINIGNNIDIVEPLRDFNGYSWTTLVNEIESINHNLIYQNLRILVGHHFLEQWIHNTEFMIDYWERLQEVLEEKYGKEKQKKIILLLCRLSILLDIKYDKEKKEKILKEKKLLEEKLKKMENKQAFILEKTHQKQDYLKTIKNIDTILNDKEKLQKEYVKRNEKLPLEEKIFSMRILSNMMIQEREECFSEIEKLDDMLKPKNFVSYQKQLEKDYCYLKDINLDCIEQQIKDDILEFQKVFFNCFEILIQKADTKQEIVKLLYEYRYYNKLPISQIQKVQEEKNLKKEKEKITKSLIQKAINFKILNRFSDQEEINNWIMEKMFYTRIMKLEDLYITITKEKEDFYLQLFDESIFEDKMKIEVKAKEKWEEKDFQIKFNKKIKLFN